MKARAADRGGGEGWLAALEFGMLSEEGFGGEAYLLAFFRGAGGERRAVGGGFAVFDFGEVDG